MWKDLSMLGGLAKRRNAERAMLGNYTPMDFGPLSDTTTMMINPSLPSEKESTEIPQLQFGEAFNTQQPIVNFDTTPSYSTDPGIDYNEPKSSLADVLDMIQMIKSPRRINIYT